MYLLFDGYKDRNILRKVLFQMYPLLYYLFHFGFPCGFCTSFSLNVLCFQRKVLILQHKNKIENMIDKPTIARIMDSTKIEEVVSEFVTLTKRGIK